MDHPFIDCFQSKSYSGKTGSTIFSPPGDINFDDCTTVDNSDMGYKLGTYRLDSRKLEVYNQQLEMEIAIEIVHSALLESEDEEGYRRFIGEVVGGTLGLELQRDELGYVELDDD